MTQESVLWMQDDPRFIGHRKMASIEPPHSTVHSSRPREETRHGHVEKSHQDQGRWQGLQPSCLEDLQVVQGILPRRTEPFPATCQGLRKGKGGGEIRT